MAAEKKPRARPGESGQSLIEFLLIVPLMVGLTILLVRVNQAIQMSIVNQQYARAQALFLAYNSNSYPQLRSRIPNLDKIGYNQMMLGVGENPIPEDTSGGSATRALASIQSINGGKGGGSDDQQVNVSDGRSKVRIRNSVALCTQTNSIRMQSRSLEPFFDINPGNLTAAGPNKLNEGVKLSYCDAPEAFYHE